MELCYRGWELEWVSVKTRDQERAPGREMVKEKGGLGLMVEPQVELQEKAASCAAWGGRGDHVGPWQWAAVGYWGVQ